MKIEFKSIDYSDLNDIHKLQPEGWASIKEDLKSHINRPNANAIKACVENKLLGVGISLSFGQTAWLDQIIVNPDYRGKGIGSEIVQYLMTYLQYKSVQTVQLIATPLGETVYKKFDFKAISDYVSLEKLDKKKTFDYSSKIVKCPESLYADLLQMDMMINGEDRNILLKPYLKNAFVYLDASIKGYYFPDLYEGPIYAIHKEAAMELIKYKSSTSSKAIVPVENENAISVLHQLGFVNQKVIGKRMLWGKSIQWEPSMIYCRVGGNYG